MLNTITLIFKSYFNESLKGKSIETDFEVINSIGQSTSNQLVFVKKAIMQTNNFYTSSIFVIITAN